MMFGIDQKKGLILEGATFKVVEIGKNYNIDDILKHNMYDKNLAMLLSEITYIPELPVPIGILYKENKPTYEQMMTEQIQEAIDLKGKGSLDKIIAGNNFWLVK
jgi:2-oxoglutarate ferredoxin oxidoreductase subunit beta